AFTLDDGYADQVRIAGPVFAEFDCPATVFVTTGFLDRQLWFWWDRIEHVFDRTTRSQFTVSIGNEAMTCIRDARDSWTGARGEFIRRCKLLADPAKLAAIEALATAAGVEVPAAAPARYAPMSWDELREWEGRGMTFGPHTVTHPILARTSDKQSRDELATGWARLSAEARRPAPVFCYPNGQPGDFGEREIETLAALGLAGAVVGTPGYAESARLRARPGAAFQVGRFNYPDDTREVPQYVTGFERLRLPAEAST
ncbi:MAG TPA: polysaccharide deacetylase family protein, partial [Gemmatimonadales bacterium]|nr:polysaccharide deacetylase family protein [Gemmatimonadales bacterium]